MYKVYKYSLTSSEPYQSCTLRSMQCGMSIPDGTDIHLY